MKFIIDPNIFNPSYNNNNTHLNYISYFLLNFLLDNQLWWWWCAGVRSGQLHKLCVHVNIIKFIMKTRISLFQIFGVCCMHVCLILTNSFRLKIYKKKAWTTHWNTCKHAPNHPTKLYIKLYNKKTGMVSFNSLMIVRTKQNKNDLYITKLKIQIHFYRL